MLILLFVCAVPPAFSQIKLGLEAGYDIINFRPAAPGTEIAGGEDYSAIPCFHAGLLSEAALGKGWFLDGSLGLAARGAHFNGESITPDFAQTVSAGERRYYLQLPVDPLYKMDMHNGWQLFVGAGPYVSYGLAALAHIPGHQQRHYPNL